MTANKCSNFRTRDTTDSSSLSCTNCCICSRSFIL